MDRTALVAATVLLLVSPVLALDGQPGIHDPSTVVMHGGRYYTYGTGAGLPMLVSDDGWTWRRAGTLMQALPGGVRARTSSLVAATIPGRLT